MHGGDNVKVLIRHLLERLVTQDTGIVDQDMNRSERLDGLLHDLFTIRHGSSGSRGLTAGLLDLLDDLGTCFGREVVDDDRGTA